MKRLLITLAKLAVSFGIVAYLVFRAEGSRAFADLVHQPKDWGLLAGACVSCCVASLLTFIRWHYLVRALGIPSSFRNNMRISFVGYFVNFAPTGIVGGDVLKAVLLAREYRDMKVKSAASVVVDRVIGLYMLFVVATVAILATGFWRLPGDAIRISCQATFWITGVGAVGFALLLIPAVTDGRLAQALCRMPKAGPILGSLLEAMRMYRRRPGVLTGAAVMSVAVHSFFAAGVFLIACGLPGEHHSLGNHFVIMPLAAATGVLPLPLGPLEAVIDTLYTQVRLGGVVVHAGQGLVVALCYRLITFLLAGIGMIYYFGSREEVSEALHEADEDSGSPPIAPINAPLMTARPAGRKKTCLAPFARRDAAPAPGPSCSRK